MRTYQNFRPRYKVQGKVQAPYEGSCPITEWGYIEPSIQSTCKHYLRNRTHPHIHSTLALSVHTASNHLPPIQRLPRKHIRPSRGWMDLLSLPSRRAPKKSFVSPSVIRQPCNFTSPSPLASPLADNPWFSSDFIKLSLGKTCCALNPVDPRFQLSILGAFLSHQADFSQHATLC